MPTVSLPAAPSPGVGTRRLRARRVVNTAIVAASSSSPTPDALADKKVVVLGGGIIGNSLSLIHI